MRTRPRTLTALAWALIGAGASIPIQVMLMQERLPWEYESVLAGIAPMNYWVMGACISCGTLALRASGFLHYAFPLLIGIVAYNNWLIEALMPENHSPAALVISVGALVLAYPLLFHGEAKVALLNPEKRWWMTPLRQRARLPVRIKVPGFKGGEIYTRTFDVSVGGAFLETSGEALSKFDEGTQCYLSVPVGGLNYINCRAEVVRSAPARGEYPSGIGIRFLGLSASDRRLLQSTVNAQAASL